MHLLDEGGGPPILMLHGNPTWSFYYRNLVLALRDTHRVVVPDHIGCGLSEKPGPEDYPYTLERRVEDLEELVDRVAPEGSLTLVVHDWGGMIGLAWAVRHPERIARIVLLNTAAFPLPPSKRLPRRLSLVRNSRLGAWLVLRFGAFCHGATRMAVTRRRLSPEVRQAYCAPYDSPRNRIATLRFVQDIPLDPKDPSWAIVEETAGRLDCFSTTPVLICWGARDFVFDDHFLAEWRRRWPHARVHRFEDCGHYVLEDACEEIVNLVRDFLSRETVSADSA